MEFKKKMCLFTENNQHWEEVKGKEIVFHRQQERKEGPPMYLSYDKI